MKKKLLLVVCMAAILTGCGAVTTDSELKGENSPSESSSAEGETSPSESASEEQETEETVTVEGTNGSVTLTIPDGWSYRCCGENDTRLLSAKYAIQFYPTEAASGYIEVGYHSMFGVCGTGLATVSKELAGDKASVGYYDGSEVWEHVIYAGKNEGIAAVASGIDSWDESDIAASMDILDTMIYEGENP